MRLVIVRHAEAARGDPDEPRSLAPEGCVQARERGVDADTVVTSPLAGREVSFPPAGYHELEL